MTYQEVDRRCEGTLCKVMITYSHHLVWAYNDLFPSLCSRQRVRWFSDIYFVFVVHAHQRC